MNPCILQNRFTGRRSVCLGRNSYYPFLLDMQARDPAKDWWMVNFSPLVALFYKKVSEHDGKWTALEVL